MAMTAQKYNLVCLCHKLTTEWHTDNTDGQTVIMDGWMFELFIDAQPQ